MLRDIVEVVDVIVEAYNVQEITDILNPRDPFNTV